MTTAGDVRAMLCESATRLFKAQVNQGMLQAARRDGWSAALWQVLEQAELPRVSVPEAAGGAGGTLADLAAVLRIAGHAAAPVPLAETAMLAGWMLTTSGLPMPRGALAAGPVQDETLIARRSGTAWHVSGLAKRVPWARVAHRLVLLAESAEGSMVVSVDPAHCRITPGSNLAGEPRDGIVLEAVAAEAAVPAGPGVTRSALHLRGALARALLSAGALEAALELSIRYAQDRVQFGRRIGQFQAIQQELARLGGEAAAAVAAAMSAAGALDRGGDVTLAVISAKIRTAEAAREGAMIAHQVHGAIGVTDEHALHHLTTRLWAWREEYGNDAVCAALLGSILQKRGADRLWPALTTN